MAERKSCGNAAYSWCAGDRKRINASAFSLPTGIMGASQTQRCLVLSLMTKTLIRSDCSDQNYFFCEYKCKSVPCLKKCEPNMTYFDGTEKKINRNKLDGVWAEWETKSGIDTVTWAENMKLCCSIGMKPIRVTDEFLSTINSIGVRFTRFKIYDSHQDSKLIKTSFWTAATRQGCAGHYRFCLHDDVGPWDSQDSFWETVNPRDTGSCLVVDRQYAKEGAPFGVRQVQCSSPTANFACQRNNTKFMDFVNSESMMPIEPEKVNTCDLPICSNPLFQEYCPPFSYHLLQWGIGKRVAESDFLHQLQIIFLIGLLLNFIVVRSECASSQLSLTRSWLVCKVFSRKIPNTGHQAPTLDVRIIDSEGNRYCVKLVNSLLKVESCEKRMKFICEGRVQAESHLQEVFNECKLTHRVTQREIDKFNTADLGSFSYKMKCFSTCMAELLGLMYDGTNKLDGVWAEWMKKSGVESVSYTTMIFGNKKVTWAENMKFCCSIGMKPIRVSDELLSKLNSNKIAYGSFYIFDKNQNSTEDRKLIKTSFWTAATRQGCIGHYRFCMHDDVGPWDSQDSFWETVNPRDTGSCLVVDRQYAKEGAPFGVRQVQCSSPTANFACQKDNARMADFVNSEINTGTATILRSPSINE
ncbi:Hypothetical predicted protein [Cloeon dipterum]|uniref:C-type lectin domain-containing protein n=1 Tax=Cloeon dipterum TaxID=197152 RepID=A0A8S1DZE2_9INSE|nr:Hypothetical predicted protein [Cloeon dipterum]